MSGAAFANFVAPLVPWSIAWKTLSQGAPELDIVDSLNYRDAGKLLRVASGCSLSEAGGRAGQSGADAHIER